MTQIDNRESGLSVRTKLNQIFGTAESAVQPADIGTAANEDVGAFATAAQGEKADTAQQTPAEGAFADGDKTKLDGIETGADVTDTANVTAAGALMDSEVTNLPAVKSFNPTDYATGAEGDLAATALQPGDAVEQTSATGSAILPVGTTAQRDGTPSTGYLRYNSTDGAPEVYDGSGWAAVGGGGVTDYQEFLTSGTWAKPDGAEWVYVEAVGGGGGGFAREFADASGGGGGAGVNKLLRASDVAATETVTVGAGGSGGIGGLAFSSGSDGGDSSFGTQVTAPGGKGSTTQTTGGDGGGGEFGGSGSVGRPAGGYSSGGGSYPQSFGGKGGNCVLGGAGGGGSEDGVIIAAGTSVFGGNGGAGNSGASAFDGEVPGGGGGGADALSSGKAGDGGDGRVRVWVW